MVMVMIIAKNQQIQTNNHHHHHTKEELKETKPLLDSSKLSTISLNGKDYSFHGYGKDNNILKVTDQEGKKYTVKNDRNFNISQIPSLELNDNQKELLSNGKSLLVHDNQNIPFKAKQNPGGTIQLTTITTEELLKTTNDKTMDLSIKSNKSQQKL